MIAVDPSNERTDAFRILYRLRESESQTARELAVNLYGRGVSGSGERQLTANMLRTMEQLGLVGREVRAPIPPHRLALQLWSLEEGGERFLEFIEGITGQVAV